MLTPAEAAGKIRATLSEPEPVRVPLADCTGRVLARPVIAERDQPPFDRVMMDGIAIAHAEFAAGNRSYRVQATQAAGDSTLALEPGSAIEIMTGASLPDGADCIIPIERVTLNEHGAHVEANYAAEHRQFIHARASDHGKGEQLLAPGTRITSTEIAVIASAGLADVDVARLPGIRVISTGNELVPAGEPIAPHQIRLSNGPAIVSMLEEHGYTDTEHEHIRDDPAALETRIGQHLADADVLVLSGGVSMGKADFVPEVLAGLGVKLVFHRISQRPGKPMWYGSGPAGQAVFALPGNPVSTLVCCRQYVLPALRQMSGMAASRPEFASLTQAVRFTPALTNFLPVKLVSNAQGQVLALPVRTNTSGDFTALAGTDGYIELEAGRSDFAQGTVVPLHRWRL